MPTLVDQFGSPLSSVSLTDEIYVDNGVTDGRASLQKVKDAVNPAIASLSAVVTPALADLLLTEQGGVNKKLTQQQLRDLFFISDEVREAIIASSDITRGWSLEDHFDANVVTDWYANGSAFTVNNADSGAGFVGEAKSSLSTVNGAIFHARFGQNAAGHMKLNGLGKLVFETRVFWPSNIGSDTLKLQFGFGSNFLTSDADQGNGFYFEWDNRQSANWRCCTAGYAVRTKTDSGVAPVANTSNRLKLVVNAGWTSCAFYIDGVLVATNTDNFPNPAALFSIFNAGYKATGSTSINWFWDYFKAWQIFN